MKTKKFASLKVVITLVVLIVCTTVNAQVKYDSNGRFTIGDTTPYHDGYKYYDVTIYLYSTVSGRPNGTWNNEMGYGQIDAFAAVSSASGNIVMFNDKTVSTSQTVAGWIIQSRNVTVINGAKLTFIGSQSTTINSVFTVNSGAQLEISK